MDVLLCALLIATGFVASTEVGDALFVTPVIERLPERHHLQIEQGLLGRVGKVMPILMSVVTLTAIGIAIWHPIWWTILAAVCLVVSIVSTVIFNVPINNATGAMDPENPPANFRQLRRRWAFFRAVRGGLQLIAFVVLCVGVVAQ